MDSQSKSDTVFSVRRFEDAKNNPQQDSTPSPAPGTDSAKKNLFGEGMLIPQSGSSHDASSSGKKASRKGSDEMISDFHSRKADQLQKYNCEGFVRSATKYHDHLNSEEKKKERVRKEIHNLESLLNEIQLKHNIDQKIDNMRNKASVLGANFDSSVKVGKGLHEKFQCIRQLSAGAEFVKLAFKKNKMEKRFVFYSETLEAICWRDPKAKIPKTKQMIYLAEIIKVNDDFKTSKAAQKFANTKIDEQTFFSIETSDRTLDLLAPNVETKKVWVKTINLLALIVKNRLRDGSSGGMYDNGLIGEREYESVAKQFAGNMGNLNSEVEEIKQLCFSNEKKLKKNFLEMAEEALMKEVDQSHRLNKAVRILDKELQEVKDESQNLKIENISSKRHLEVAHIRERQLVSQLRSYNEEKKGIVDFIRQFQKKLLNCVEFLGLLDFEVHEKNGAQLVSTNNVAEGAVLNEDFANLDVFMNQMQVQFDTIMLRTNNMQKKFVELQEKVKKNSRVHDATQKDRETWANKYNEIYALYNEAVMEKEKLSSDASNLTGQLNYNVKENIKMKKEISELENQLNEIKKAHVAKDSELQDMIEYARRLQGSMENQFEELRKEGEKSEMEKLTLLEDRYNNQIRRYENKILENDKMINELSELVQNYETQMDELVGEIDKKQVFIDDLTSSRDKLNHMIVEMEDNLKRNKDLKTPARRSTAATSNQYDDTSALESPAESKEVLQDETNLLNTQQKIDIVVSARDAIHKQHVAEMEANLKHHVDEIKRLEEENQQYNVRVSKVKEHEDELKQKITRYQYKMKGIMEEGAKVRKHFKQLELYMSHWLNLIYLENVIMCVDETDSFSFTVFSKEVNHNILSRAVDRVKQAFHGVSTHSEFLKDIIRHVEASIPNISFDIKAIELARAYRHKSRAKATQPRKRSTDLCFVGGYQGNMVSPFRSGSANRRQEDQQQLGVVREASEEREPLRQIQSPIVKKVDDTVNRELNRDLKKVEGGAFIRKAVGMHRSGEKDKENRENAQRVRPGAQGVGKERVSNSMI